jgi:hypothetical protein
LKELTASLRKQTELTVSLERRLKLYKYGFFITAGVGCAAISAAALLYFTQ